LRRSKGENKSENTALECCSAEINGSIRLYLIHFLIIELNNEVISASLIKLVVCFFQYENQEITAAGLLLGMAMGDFQPKV